MDVVECVVFNLMMPLKSYLSASRAGEAGGTSRADGARGARVSRRAVSTAKTLKDNGHGTSVIMITFLMTYYTYSHYILVCELASSIKWKSRNKILHANYLTNRNYSVFRHLNQ